MNRHKFFDGVAEVRTYGVIKGCDCAWCASQRQESRNHSHTDHIERHGRTADITPERAGEMLDKYARQIAKRDGIAYLEALRYAQQEFPKVAAIYNDLSTHERYRGEE